ncbi:C-type lectin domain family 2 member D isoform X2 [Alligator mississippiensis]|nr:C-type lectin domain family 2 member D isoform X2 [Alligator mississippiensis]
MNLQADSVCRIHKAELSFFCVEDQSLICKVCRTAREHKSHMVIPRAEAEAMGSTVTGNTSVREKTFPRPGSSSAVDSHLSIVELAKEAVDEDTAMLKENNPSGFKMQRFLVWTILIIFLIAIGGLGATIFVFTRASGTNEPADQRPSIVPCCPPGWIASLGNCYYLSEEEKSWDLSQDHCFSHGASLAVASSLEALAAVHRAGASNHWIGLRRDPGQSWRWVNGAEFNHSFEVHGGGSCAYLTASGVDSAKCSTERRWVCGKVVEPARRQTDPNERALRY